MNTQAQIQAYLDAHPEPKRSDLHTLHRLMLARMPGGRLWFLDGKDDQGKVVSNPSVGYGLRVIRYANGSAKDFYQIGLSANTTGISVYIMGIPDKQHLPQTYGQQIGKASVTGYCIKFKSLADVRLDVLEAAIQDGIAQSRAGPAPPQAQA